MFMNNLRHKLCIFILVAVLFGCGSGCFREITSLDDLNKEEQKYAEDVLSNIKQGMSAQEVERYLAGLGVRFEKQLMVYSWYPALYGKFNQVRVYFYNEKVINVRWMKMGNAAFVYEPLKLESGKGK